LASLFGISISAGGQGDQNSEINAALIRVSTNTLPIAKLGCWMYLHRAELSVFIYQKL
jgi:hypothetical protein